MNPTQRAEGALAIQPPASIHAQSWQRRGSRYRWAAAISAAASIAALSAVVASSGSEEAFEWQTQDGVDSFDVEPTPDQIIKHQFRRYHGRAQRFSLYCSLAQILLSEGRYAEAELRAAEAVEVAQGAAERSQAQQLLGLALLRQSRLRDAREVLEGAVASLEQAEPSVRVGVLRALADARAGMGHLEAALDLYQQAFALTREGWDVLGDAALLAADIGEVWAHIGNLQEALDWLHHADQLLDVGRSSAPGVDEMVAAKVRSLFGITYHLMGNVPRASELYREAARAQARGLRPSHPDLVATQLGLARAQRDSGDSRSALQTLDDVEAALRREPHGLDLSRTLIMKSDLLREANQTEAAEETIKETILLHDALFQGEDHPEAAIALSSYGSILHDSGNADEAREKYREALAISIRTVGEQHPGTAAAYNSLGTLYEDLGDDQAAREHFSKCLDIQLGTLGKESPDVANTYNNLATVLFRQGRPAESLALLRSALQVLDAAGVPKDSPDRALYEENLGEVLASIGDVAAQSSFASA